MEAWKVAKLSSLSVINYGYTESASAAQVGPRFLRITDIQPEGVDWLRVPFCPIDAAGLSKFRLAHDDIVFARTGATTGKSFLVQDPPEAVFASYLIRLRLRTEELLPKFVNLFFQTPDYWRAIAAGSTGSAQGGVNASKLGDLSIRFPSVATQLRIVAILDEAFEGLATAKANAEKNLLNARAWALRQLATVLSDASTTEGARQLDTLVAPGCSLSYGIVQPGDEVSAGLPVVRPVDLGSKMVRVDGLKRIDHALARSYARTTLEGGDLLLCVRGTTGKVAVAELALAGANVTRGIVPIRFDQKLVLQSLGYYLLRSEPFQAQIRAKTYGTALMQINIGDLRQIVLRSPPIDRQAEIVEQLDAVQEAADQLAVVYQRKLAALDELKKSLLHQAFSGAL